MLFNGIGGSEAGGTDRRTDIRTDGRTDGWTDVWKFTPVSYMTWALWGRCPKRVAKHLNNMLYSVMKIKVFSPLLCSMSIAISFLPRSVFIFDSNSCTSLFFGFVDEATSDTGGRGVRI